MNRQEIFDRAVIHAKTMNQVCMVGDTCAYRGENGQMCLIGSMIKDEFYDPSIENSAAHTFKVIEALIASGIEIKNSNNSLFLSSLQACHDRVPSNYEGEDFKESIKGRLGEFAEQNGLQFNW